MTSASGGRAGAGSPRSNAATVAPSTATGAIVSSSLSSSRKSCTPLTTSPGVATSTLPFQRLLVYLQPRRVVDCVSSGCSVSLFNNSRSRAEGAFLIISRPAASAAPMSSVDALSRA